MKVERDLDVQGSLSWTQLERILKRWEGREQDQCLGQRGDRWGDDRSMSGEAPAPVPVVHGPDPLRPASLYKAAAKDVPPALWQPRVHENHVRGNVILSTGLCTPVLMLSYSAPRRPLSARTRALHTHTHAHTERQILHHPADCLTRQKNIIIPSTF